MDSQGLGLFDDLDPLDKQNALDLAHEQLVASKSFDEDFNLALDAITVPGQQFCVVNWIGPTFKAKSEIYGMRIMGTYKTLDEAKSYATRVHQWQPSWDTGIMEMNLWCFGYPSADYKSVQEVDKALNEFIIRHKTALEESKQLFEARKHALRKSTITKEVDAPPLTLTQSSYVLTPTLTPTLTHTDLPVLELEHDCSMKVPNQEYAVISYVGHTGNNSRIPICIKGIFPDVEKAEEHISKLMKIDPTYDIITAPLYQWIPCDPDISKLRQKHQNEKLNELLETEENEKLEALQLHQAVKSRRNMDEPVNGDYQGKGFTATEILDNVENNIHTYSFNQ